jgi:iron(III) transport system substrate-binding protein
MNHRRRFLFVSLVAMLAVLATACGPSTEPSQPNGAQGSASTPTTASAAGASTPSSGAAGEVVLYTTRSEALIKPVIDAFQSANPGIEVVLLTGQNAQLAAKMLEERANPQADIFINTDTVSMASLASQGLFEANSSESVKSVPDQYRADDGSWVALTLRARVIMYNTNLVQAGDLPKSMFDLIDPKWKGQVGSADSTNGSLQGQIVAMRHLLGDTRTEEFVRGLVANDTKFFGGHTDVRKAVGAGELKLGLVNHYYYQLSKAEGAPVGVVYPDQETGQPGVFVNSTNAGILKDAPNPAGAQAFLDYLLTPEGQKVFAELNYEYPIIEGVALAEGVQPLDSFRLADVQLRTLGAEIQPATELMQTAGLP